MARISNRQIYAQDTNLENGDYLLGTDISGSVSATKTYSLESLREFFQVADIRDNTGFWRLPSISKDGQSIDQSQLEQYAVRNESSVTYTSAGTTHQVINAQLENDGIDGVHITIYDYDFPIYLPSFAGTSVSVTTDEGTFTGTVDRLKAHSQFGKTDGDTVTGTLPGSTTTATVHKLILKDVASAPNTSPRTVNSVTFTSAGNDQLEYLELRVNADIRTRSAIIEGDLTVGTVESGTSNSTSQFNGPSQFNADITVGTDQTDTQGGLVADIILNGNLRLDDDQGGIVFGDNPFISFIPDHTNDRLDITGAASILQTVAQTTSGANSDHTYQEGADIHLNGDSTIYKDNVEIVPVQGNIEQRAADSNGGTLTHITIGDTRYNTPIASSQVAQILPGLHQDLLPTPAGGTSFTSLFFGDDEGTFANWQSGTVVLTQETIAGGTTTHTFSAGGGASGNNANLINTAFSSIPRGQRLFLYTGAHTTLPTTAGTMVSGSVYEVVNYNHTTRTVTFSLLGEGTLVVSSANFHIDSDVLRIQNDSLPDGSNDATFLTAEAADSNGRRRIRQNTISNIAGAQAQATYRSGDRDTAITGATALHQIEYECANDEQVTVDGNDLVVDVSGRYKLFNSGAEINTGDTLTESSLMVLLGQPQNSSGDQADQTLILPVGEAGDSIKIVNLSQVGQTSSNVWIIQGNNATGTNERIMKSTEVLRLDDASASFELVYTSAAIGWVIVGIN